MPFDWIPIKSNYKAIYKTESEWILLVMETWKHRNVNLFQLIFCMLHGRNTIWINKFFSFSLLFLNSSFITLEWVVTVFIHSTKTPGILTSNNRFIHNYEIEFFFKLDRTLLDLFGFKLKSNWLWNNIINANYCNTKMKLKYFVEFSFFLFLFSFFSDFSRACQFC